MRHITCGFLAQTIHAAPLANAFPPPRQGQSESGSGVTIVFTDKQRAATQSWYAEQQGKGCPPGLAKKNNGCMPPGQAKKRYAVGHPLPAGIVLQPLPSELSRRVGVAPPGYIYAQVDGDLLKLAAGTLLVIDAIQGLSH